jgi:seryl-tRNA synthetase
MLQVSVLRAAPEEVKQKLAKKNFKDLQLVDTIVQLDDDRKKLQASFDDTQAKVNAASKEIGMLMGKGDKDGAEVLKQNVATWKQTLEPLKEQMAVVEKQLADALS